MDCRLPVAPGAPGPVPALGAGVADTHIGLRSRASPATHGVDEEASAGMAEVRGWGVAWLASKKAGSSEWSERFGLYCLKQEGAVGGTYIWPGASDTPRGGGENTKGVRLFCGGGESLIVFSLSRL